MRFLAPEWFLLVPAFALATWIWPGLRLWWPLRAAALLTATLILAQPQVRTLADGVELWVLLDRSESTGSDIDDGLPEWQSLLERSRRDSDDEIIYADFASEFVVQRPPENLVFTGNRKLTRTRLAAESALALSDPDKPSRILLFTDGYGTAPLGDLGDRLSAGGVALDYRLVRDPEADDFQLRPLRMPERVQVGEPFVIEIEIAGTVAGQVPLELSRDGQVVHSATIDVAAAPAGGGSPRALVRLTDRVAASGSSRYVATIAPAGDAHPGNNRAGSWIEVAGGPRVLLATAYTDDPLAAALAAQGFEVDLADEPATLHLGRLTGCSAVILNNVPAWEMPADVLKALDFYVKAQAGGLLMVGGKRSFGAGGYFESAVDPLLPVSMELKNEHRKLSAAMAIVMDRSGSMSMTVGSGGVTKMDLANEGAARAIELLGGNDQVVVFAVDSTPHEVVPLQQVEANRDKMIELVRRIESTGGGIFVYNGLEAAWGELQRSGAGTRHIVLFTDANDSEQPAQYKTLVAEMVAEGATISVIGLGTPTDSDAAFITDIAKRGNGRIFFTDQPADLPNLFAQETVAVARSTFITEPTPTRDTGQWFQVAARATEWPAGVDGYNLSYLRPGATSAIDSADGYDAPLVAFWNQGLGRVAAVSFPTGGDFSESVRAWDGYGDFLQTLTRWLTGDPVPSGLGLRHRLEGNRLSLDLFYDDEWQERFASDPPEIRLAPRDSAAGDSADAAGPDTGSLAWERMAPGRFSAHTELEEGDLVRGAVRVGTSAIPFGPLAAGTSAEWSFEPARLTELRHASTQSGGRELVDLRDAWRNPPSPRFSDVRAPLGTLLLVLILADALATRMGWRLPGATKIAQRGREIARTRTGRAAAAATERPATATVSATAAASATTKTEDASTPPPEEEPPPPAPASPPSPTTEKSPEDRAARSSERFRRAKRR